ncbi:hypothetical protein B0J13DRAFT_240874 [Dactylonectria estremocensis]|uniref:F-box domain-containing protein n=1 Tax=Dactylonectria estremocensis TaxID=1079267 RepID=A0A9P9IAH0_9HYPO|nr:hypothetical protein B0J13DRAFT_240874 [Dactylonectria estremocensis]
MPRLLDCPREIAHAILGLVKPADLYWLCLVNQGLRTLAEPLLYSIVDWNWKLKQPQPPITLLLRSLLHRPELSQLVQSLVIDGNWFASSEFSPPKLAITALDMDKVGRFIQGTRVPFAEDWINEVRAGTFDAIATVLVSQLSNITHLHLGPNVVKHSKFFGMLLRSAVCPPLGSELPRFEQLRHVTYDRFVEHEHDKMVPNPADALSLFYLPVIEHISASIRDPKVFSWPTSRPDPSTITSLDIRGLREPHLGQLLSATKSLKKLHWEWHYAPFLKRRDKFNTPIINLDHIVDVLSNVRETLTELSLMGSEGMDDGGNYPPLGVEGSFGGIVDFRRIERLQVPLVFLVGFSPETTDRLEHAMPPNVESVTITDDLNWDDYEWEDKHILQMIELWMDHGKDLTPQLRKIRLLLAETRYEWDHEMRGELATVCNKVGIEVEVTTLSDIGTL